MTVVEDPSQGTQAPGTPQPRQLIVSLYGLYARQNAGWLSIASVVRMLAELGVDGQAVRSSISRLKRRGLLVAKRVGGAAGYELSPMGYDILAEGDARIFGRRRAVLEDGWLLVVFSVPESERDKRHRLRSQLTRLGFGTVAPGVWVAPGHLVREATEVLERLDLVRYTDVFSARHVTLEESQDNVGRWWDLAALRTLYSAFIARYGPVRQQWSGPGDVESGEAFAVYVEMVTAWRQLPYADPGLPLELLPPGWNGVEAEELFDDLRELLAAPAAGHAATLLAGSRR